MKLFTFILALLIIPSMACAEEKIIINHHIDNDGTLTIKDLNIRITIPKGWYIMEDKDWHNIAILISRKNTYTIKDAMITVSFGPLLEETLGNGLHRMVKELLARYKPKKAICIGCRQPATIAGIEGFSEIYLFRVKEGVAFSFTFTMFKKNKFGYSIILCQPLKNDGAFLKAYWEVVDSFEFIDPGKDIPTEIQKKLIREQQKLFHKGFKGPKIEI